MTNSIDTIISEQTINTTNFSIDFSHQVAFLVGITVLALISTWSVFFIV